MKQATLILLLLITSPVFGAGDIVQEKVMDTPNGAVWAMRWSYGNAWLGTLTFSFRSESNAESYLLRDVLETCRSEKHRTYRYATFSDIHAPSADPRLKMAWDHFGGSAQQSGAVRKTSFKLVFFHNDRTPPSKEWISCWSPRQLKAERLEEKRKQRLEKEADKQKKKMAKSLF